MPVFPGAAVGSYRPKFLGTLWKMDGKSGL